MPKGRRGLIRGAKEAGELVQLLKDQVHPSFAAAAAVEKLIGLLKRRSRRVHEGGRGALRKPCVVVDGVAGWSRRA